jgi:hypothetical protein
MNVMKLLQLAPIVLLAAVIPSSAAQQRAQYPPLADYMLPHETEVALAESAAPAHISGGATIKVLTASGYQVARTGDNGFECMVMRGWTAPTYTPVELRGLVYDASVRAPICFDPEAVRTVMPYYELRSRLGMAGQTPDQITGAVEGAYKRGDLPKRERVSFAYMWSADQHLGPGIGHWHPHMMVFAPNYRNAALGNSEFGRLVPFVSDDGGTPFAVVVIPVDDKLAIKAAAGAANGPCCFPK